MSSGQGTTTRRTKDAAGTVPAKQTYIKNNPD